MPRVSACARSTFEQVVTGLAGTSRAFWVTLAIQWFCCRSMSHAAGAAQCYPCDAFKSRPMVMQVWLKRNVPEVQLDEPQQSSTTRKSRTTVEDLAPRPSGGRCKPGRHVGQICLAWLIPEWLGAPPVSVLRLPQHCSCRSRRTRLVVVCVLCLLWCRSGCWASCAADLAGVCA